jgi:nicotinamide-nucleotide amidase
MADSALSNLVETLAGMLLAKGWSMATAESCTGGWIAKCCTDRAGSSAWFDRGLVTYSDAAKSALLGVESTLLQQHGAVSEAVVRQMSLGARKSSGVEVAVAVTGIAGPDGGSAAKPVGTVWFAWSVAGLETRSERQLFSGDRESIRFQTVQHALQGLCDQLSPNAENQA